VKNDTGRGFACLGLCSSRKTCAAPRVMLGEVCRFELQNARDEPRKARVWVPDTSGTRPVLTPKSQVLTSTVRYFSLQPYPKTC
jgi:hypothetical protein